MAKQKSKAAGKYSSSYADMYYDVSCALTVRKVRGQRKAKASTATKCAAKGKADR